MTEIIETQTVTITNPVIDSKTKTSKPKSKKFDEFMKAHLVKPGGGGGTDKEITNTRIGDPNLKIPGGSYHIPPEEYPEFLKLYDRDILKKKKAEYLTEKQLATDGAILCDIDLRFPYETETRYYTKDHIEELIYLYLDELKKMYQFDEDTNFHIIVFEKDEVNRQKDKNRTKDGIHLVIHIKCDRVSQQILRKRVIGRIGESSWANIPITNTWDDAFDEGIVKGTCNWQLIGSGKPNHAIYKMTTVKYVTYDPRDEEFGVIDVHNFNISDHLEMLSVRYTGNYAPFLRGDFSEEHSAFLAENGGEVVAKKRAKVPMGGAVVTEGITAYENLRYCNTIKNADDLKTALEQFLDSLGPKDYEIHEAYKYTMILPATFYGQGSFMKWIRVGWALRNISDHLFIVWLAFSAKSDSFAYSEIRDLYDKWTTFDLNDPNGLTKRSIMHWAKNEVFEEYEKVRVTTIDYFIDQVITSCIAMADEKSKSQKCSDYDIAIILYELHKDEYVCSSIKNKTWHRFVNHRWEDNDSGTSLRRAITDDLRRLFEKKIHSIQTQLHALPNGGLLDDSDPEKAIASPLKKSLEMRKRVCMNIHGMIGNTCNKKNIMTEAADLFYDKYFTSKLDENVNLLCFNNGVYDFKEGIFRMGKPEDYISKTTRIDYIPLDDTSKSVQVEIEDFMCKLFPDSNLRKYMWEHLASTLIGGNKNQTINNYIGVGQNGKSVLIQLMEKVLGDYKGDVALSLITEKRGSIGGVSPEIVGLKGIRFAVMQEPSKDDVINEGMMKQLTGGDKVQGRALYSDVVSFTPQFKMVVCANYFMEIKSQDHGTWRRIRAVEFESLFTENPTNDDPDKPHQFKLDKNIIDKFKKWKTTFMGMLMEIAVRTKGMVTDCERVLAYTNEYRKNQDLVAGFLSENVVEHPGSKLQKKNLHQMFKEWMAENGGNKKANTRDLNERMDKLYGKYTVTGWKNVALIVDVEHEDEN